MVIVIVIFQVEKNETNVKISCHHGEEECVGNKIQSCILEGSAIPSNVTQVKIIDCLMKEAKRSEPYPTKMVSFTSGQKYFRVAQLILFTSCERLSF